MGKRSVKKPEKNDLLKERAKVKEKFSKGENFAIKKKIESGRIYINSTYNNTIITLTDEIGNVVFWSSAGHIGFKGTKKGTSFAASKVAEFISDKVKKLGVKQLSIFTKGIGPGREGALRGLGQQGLNIIFIKDVTPIPHNGCRARKVRRV